MEITKRNKVLPKEHDALQKYHTTRVVTVAETYRWFNRTKRKIGRSTVYDHLDPHRDLSKKRKENKLPGNYQLEGAVWTWHLDEAEQSTDEDLVSAMNYVREKTKAWNIPILPEGKVCKSETYWAKKFKERFTDVHTAPRPTGRPRKDTGVRAAKRANRNQMSYLFSKEILDDFGPGNVYDFTEIRLLWHQPLSIECHRESRVVSVALCCNANGLDILSPFLVTRNETPSNLAAAKFKLHWRDYRLACMSDRLMVEWLELFYDHIGRQRRVLLTIPSFHKATSEICCPPPANITIRVCPPKEEYQQPLQQGVVQDFKYWYRTHWLCYMRDEYLQKRDPLRTTTPKDKCERIDKAWYESIRSELISSSFIRASNSSSLAYSNNPERIIDLQILFEMVRTTGDIQNCSTVTEFLNPPEESIPRSEHTLNQAILWIFAKNNENPLMHRALQELEEC